MSFFRRIFETLKDHYERQPPQPWWPEDPLEVIVGAVLVQGTTWKSVSKILESLQRQGMLDFRKFRDADVVELAESIRSVGFQAKKAQRLKEIAGLFLDRSDGNIERFFMRDPDSVRKELLTVRGIGPGTADNIMLYAGNVPIYMVDPFTVRVLVRHGIISPEAREPEIQRLVHQELTPDEEPYGARLFREFQEMMVRLGRDFCDKSVPACDRCPLHEFLPEGKPLGVEEKRVSVAKKNETPKSPGPVSPIKPVGVQEPLPEIDREQLSDTERRVLEQLDDVPVPIDSLIAATQLPAHIVRGTIAMLEMRRFVKQVEGNRVQRLVLLKASGDEYC